MNQSGETPARRIGLFVDKCKDENNEAIFFQVLNSCHAGPIVVA